LKVNRLACLDREPEVVVPTLVCEPSADRILAEPHRRIGTGAKLGAVRYWSPLQLAPAP